MMFHKNKNCLFPKFALIFSLSCLNLLISTPSIGACEDELLNKKDPAVAKVAEGTKDTLLMTSGDFTIDTFVLKMEENRVLFSQIIPKAKNSNKPTLLLLPGVNRSVILTEPAAVALAKLGYGVATFHFSVQPLSVAQLKSGESPYFQSHELGLSDLANEVEFVAKKIAEIYQIEDIIPVTLSYSGAVSPYLTSFPLIIDTVPMTSSAAANPQLENYRRTLKAGELWNPIFGPGITRNLLDTAYRQSWTKQVASISEQYSLPKERSEVMIAGYTQLSRATEGFAWTEDPALMQYVANGATRFFVVTGKDSPSLLKDQLETFQSMLLKPRSDAILVLVMDTGHVFPSERPVEYALVIDWLLNSNKPLSQGVVVIKPSTEPQNEPDIQFTTGKAAEEFIKNLIDQL